MPAATPQQLGILSRPPLQDKKRPQ